MPPSRSKFAVAVYNLVLALGRRGNRRLEQFPDLQSSTTSSTSSNCMVCFGNKLNYLALNIKDDVDNPEDSDEFEDCGSCV